MLGAIIDRLSRRHPRVRFEATLGGGLTDLQYRELQAHNIDLIIGRLPRATPEDCGNDNPVSRSIFFRGGNAE